MKQLTLLIFLFLSLAVNAQKTDDVQLNNRLHEYLLLTKQLDFEKLIEFMHPKLFAIMPKEQLVQTMQQAFSNDQMKIGFDSVGVAAISPIYKVGKTLYRKIDYYAGMHIAFNDSLDLKNPAIASQMQSSFRKSLLTKNVSLDIEHNAVQIAGKDVMFAIKDPGEAEWMFLGYDRSNSKLVAALIPKQVLQYFKIK